MSIDYGRRRSGVAVTDPLQIVAGGLDTVESSSLLDFIVKYTQGENVERIVIGMPTQSNGQPSENAARVRSFAGKLKKAVDIPVEFYDERFTSVLANKALLEGAAKKKTRQDKALIDTMSATIILTSYMEYRRNFKL